jgi:excisionase family DNA binding protein
MNNLILSPISLGELQTALTENVCNEVKKLFNLHQHPQPIEFITRQQTAVLLGVSLVTLNEWQKSGRVIGYRIGSRVRYKRAEVINSLTKIQTTKLGRAV